MNAAKLHGVDPRALCEHEGPACEASWSSSSESPPEELLDQFELRRCSSRNPWAKRHSLPRGHLPFNQAPQIVVFVRLGRSRLSAVPWAKVQVSPLRQYPRMKYLHGVVFIS